MRLILWFSLLHRYRGGVLITTALDGILSSTLLAPRRRGGGDTLPDMPEEVFRRFHVGRVVVRRGLGRLGATALVSLPLPDALTPFRPPWATMVATVPPEVKIPTVLPPPSPSITSRNASRTLPE